MKNFRHILLAGVGLTAVASAGLAQSQAVSGHDHHAAAPVVSQTAAQAAEMSTGEVRKIDMQSRRITLKHGPLKNLDMPPMTMAFQVTDPAMLGKVKVGDKVRFVAANPGGKLTLTDIQVAP